MHNKLTQILAFVCVALAVAACAGVRTRPDGGKGLLPVGSAAPDLVGYDVAGTAMRLSDARGRPAVVYFYPKDGTPGCTKEACAFRDAWKRFAAAGVSVFGVSSDSRESHQEFARDHHLPFPLVADEDESVARAWGVGSSLFGYSRVSFLVGPDGHVARVFPDVNPGVHAAEVLAAAAALPAPRPEAQRRDPRETH